MLTGRASASASVRRPRPAGGAPPQPTRRVQGWSGRAPCRRLPHQALRRLRYRAARPRRPANGRGGRVLSTDVGARPQARSLRFDGHPAVPRRPRPSAAVGKPGCDLGRRYTPVDPRHGVIRPPGRDRPRRPDRPSLPRDYARPVGPHARREQGSPPYPATSSPPSPT